MIPTPEHVHGASLAARFLLVVMFPFSVLDKIMHWDEAMAQAKTSFLPGAPLLLIAAILVECLTPVMILAGWYAGWAAVLLAGFCIVTALLYHPFWKFPDFWSKPAEGRAHFWDFLKNLGLAGGLLLVPLLGIA
ncbi:MAG: DoxX family protein [Janthinobacterium lividum]